MKLTNHDQKTLPLLLLDQVDDANLVARAGNGRIASNNLEILFIAVFNDEIPDAIRYGDSVLCHWGNVAKKFVTWLTHHGDMLPVPSFRLFQSLLS